MTGPRILLALAAALLATPVAAPAMAQDYPSRPVRIIVPFGPGGPADVVARQLGSILQENFGQPFVVENRTGAGGVIGTVEAAKSPPDGYTLLMMSNTQTANESLVPTRKYELMRDLIPIPPVNSSDRVIAVQPSVLANVPTASEAGVPGYEATIWLGFMAPTGTPKPIIEKLNAAVNAAVKRPDIVKLWTEQGAVPMSMTPEEFEKFLRGDIVKWAEVVKKFDKP